MSNNLQPLETDKKFLDSPDAGHPNCICSRCGKVIEEEDAPAIRMWPDDIETNKENNYEYRYHMKCLGLST